LLLLGIGESGKSTLFKQMKILYGDYEMSQAAMDQVKQVVFSNVLESMQTLLENCQTFGLRDTMTCGDAWHVAAHATIIDIDVGLAVEALWATPEIQQTWAVWTKSNSGRIEGF